MQSEKQKAKEIINEFGKLPLRCKGVPPIYIVDSNDVIVANFCGSDIDCYKLVDALNGNNISDIPNDGWTIESSNQIRILNNGKRVLLIRGYGYLSGIGGLNLSEEESVNIQMNFAEKIIKKLNG